mgnify:CR=1 FL=1
MATINIKTFTETARKRAKAQSIGYCARHIRMALEAAGGVVNPRPVSAKDYGRVMTDNDFNLVCEVINDGYKAKNGDVIVWGANSSTIHGHIQVYVQGFGWVSDFKQATIFPNSRKQELWLNGGYTIYRYNE